MNKLSLSNKAALIVKLIRSFLKDECGAVAIEYGMIGAVISILVIPAPVVLT